MCPAVTTSASDTGGGYSELTDVRLWHLFVFILVLGILLAIVRDTVGRIALIVFFTALGEVVLGTTAVMALFRTIGAIGMAISF